MKDEILKLQNDGYTYLVKAKDKFLSGWGCAEGKTHFQIVACKTERERDRMFSGFSRCNEFSHVQWYKISTELNYFVRQYQYKSYRLKTSETWTRPDFN